MRHGRYKGKGKLSRNALMSIFLEEAKRILEDDQAARAAAEEAMRSFSRNYPQMLESD
ncbi:MAG: hypothetical protein OEZ04_06295 [Nitrospinota bacterium]|nr:hypothetical protein [Nitrospinota bacterium]